MSIDFELSEGRKKYILREVLRTIAEVYSQSGFTTRERLEAGRLFVDVLPFLKDDPDCQEINRTDV